MPHVREAEVTPPGVPDDLVERTSLLDRLDATTGTVLVCAPAGHGKTLLLADWARRPSGEDTAWVRVDRGNADPVRFWAAVATAVATAGHRGGPSDERAPGDVTEPVDGTGHIVPPAPDDTLDPGDDPAPEDVVGRLDALVRARCRPVRLVLDDVHELADPRTLSCLEALARNGPPGLRLVLSGRQEPSLALARLRPAGRLTELRAADLQFSPAESATLLTSACPGLSPCQAATLHARTGGWPAGLRLAALAVAGATDPAAAVAEFSGDDPAVAAYLAEEVLDPLTDDLVEFLRSVSPCDPVPVELAVDMTGREDAGVLLDQLDHRTSLVVRTGRERRAYRIHELLRAHLNGELRRRSPRRAAELRSLATRWWAEQCRPEVALEHAVDGGGPALLVDTVHTCAIPLLLSGELDVLRCALTRAGPRAVAIDPFLAVASALVHGEAGEYPAAREHLRHARRSWPPRPGHALTLLRILAELWEDGTINRVGPADPDTDLPPEPELEGLTRLARGIVRLTVDGDGDGARRELEDAAALARAHGFDHLTLQALSLAATAAIAAGDLRDARDRARRAVVHAAEHGWERAPWTLAATAVLAYTSLMRAEPREARRLAAEALTLAPATTAPPLLFGLRTVHGAATVDCAEQARGLALLQQARAELGDTPVAPFQAASAAMLEFRAALALGHGTAAHTVQGWLIDRVGETAEAHVQRARAEAAAGRHRPAREILRPVLDGTVAPLLATTAVEAWLLETALASTSGERPAARHALQSALALAVPRDALRPFAQAGPHVGVLLAHQQGTFGPTGDFADRALAAHAGERNNPAALLSEREGEVLAMLPSLLSLEEIAVDLSVSVNTVKSHVRSIYAKLGVSSRRLAVLAAHERGLLGAPVMAG